MGRHISHLLPEELGINCWVYFLGETAGEDIKVGYSTGRTVRDRVRQVNAEQTTSASYVLLAAIRGDRKDEQAILRYFDPYVRTDKGSRKEYLRPVPEVAEYVNWLRQWWWACIDDGDLRDDVLAMSPEMWTPKEDRRLAPPPSDPGALIQSFQVLAGPLAGTPWDWMLSPKQSVQDYFTPREVIDAATVAMGGIDLDAASHPLANREHQIPDYFHVNRSAFDNDWHGRVWLNPPYGNNAPWFDRVVRFYSAGDVSQLCMLSPLWAFTAEQARPAMRLASATVLLSPTPKFWGNSENKTGTNHPHAIVYFGSRTDEFLAAFQPYGIPIVPAWDRLVPPESPGVADDGEAPF